jgi:fimbrial chaperone protein
VRSFVKPLLAVVVSGLLSGAALAGAFQISPIRISLSGQAPIAVLTVRNQSAETSVMQLKAMAWTQSGNDDIYTPTDEVLATPPIFSVPPGGSQIIRVGIRRQPHAQRELAYRLFLQEVPVTASAAKGGDVKVALRFGIPVFLAPASQKSPKPVLDWRVLLAAPNTLRIEAVNRGNAHVQITGIGIHAPDGGPLLAEHRGMDYVLPQQGRHWQVPVNPLQPLQPPGTPLKILAQTDAGEFHADVALEP